jgi:hypothetical protein
MSGGWITVDGTSPSGTAKCEKRNTAAEIPNGDAPLERARHQGAKRSALHRELAMRGA